MALLIEMGAIVEVLDVIVQGEAEMDGRWKRSRSKVAVFDIKAKTS